MATHQAAHIEVADYKTNQKQVRYRGNKLIEALPLPLGDDELYLALELMPEFDPATRQWEDAERLRELMCLSNIMVPLTAHIQLGHGLDSMMREGYIGREPLSADHVGIYLQIQQDELDSKAGKPFRQSQSTLTPKLSQALIGVSGMGKTTTVQRVLARYPKVIYHPEIDVYQIPWLHFEMPKDGGGVKALLISIVEAISELVPDNTYYEDYVVRARPSEAALQSSVRRLLNKHCVGLLIPDEVQNAANSRKSDQVVMTELTTLANKSRAPVLYIGTPKANKILGLDLRQGRRAMNMMLGNWSPLPRHEVVTDEHGNTTKLQGEWVDLITAMWKYCWLRKPVPLSERLLDTIYECTQGVIDLAIKLLIMAQARAILNKSEMYSEQLFRTVYEEQFGLIHPMIDAYRRGDRVALARYEDLELPDTERMLGDIEIRERATRGRAASTRPGKVDFVPRLADAGEALGLVPEDALVLAQQVAEDGSAKNMLDAVVQMAKKAAPPPKATSGTNAKRGRKNDESTDAPHFPGLDARPDDLRNAIVLAAKLKTPVVEQLLQLKMILEVEDVICLA
jgi:hypothetical protein